jgi:putative ABC transport system permease protein
MAYREAGVASATIEVGNYGEIDLWIPLQHHRNTSASSMLVSLSGTLKPGVTVDQANAELQRLTIGLRERFPEGGATWAATALTAQEALKGKDTWTVSVMLGLVVLAIFGIACANVTNVMTADLVAHQHDIAVRVALGACWRRVMQHRLAEALTLVSVAALLAFGVAAFAIRLLRVSSQDAFFRLLQLNPRVLALSFAVALLITFVVAGGPTLFAWKSVDLADRGRGTSKVRSRGFRSSLVILQLSFSFILLVVGGLCARSAANLVNIPTGLDPKGLVVVSTALDGEQYDDRGRLLAATDAIVKRLRAVAGVSAVSVSDVAPLMGQEVPVQISVVGPSEKAGPKEWIDKASVSASYFEVFGVPVLLGESLPANEASPDISSIVVNRKMARRYWGDSSPVGARIRVSRPDGSQSIATVVGVVGDVKGTELKNAAPSRMYELFDSRPSRTIMLGIRASETRLIEGNEIMRAIHEIDDDLAVGQTTAVEDVVVRLKEDDLRIARMFGIYGAVALVLAAIGMYGLTSFGVSLRMPEIGIRRALGASSWQLVRRLVIDEGRVLAIGLIIGAVGAAGIAVLVAHLFVGVAPLDPVTFMVSAATLAVASAIAVYSPIRRATKMDPTTLIRSTQGT